MTRPASLAPVTRPTGGATPAARLAGYIAQFDPPVARIVRAARRILRRRFPTAIELVYDNYNALAIGWAATERASDAIMSRAVYARGINLYFIHGARLPDPAGLLEGGGRRDGGGPRCQRRPGSEGGPCRHSGSCARHGGSPQVCLFRRRAC